MSARGPRTAGRSDGGSGLTGEPHIDARLAAWNPADGERLLADELPAPGRERRARLALLGLVVLVLLGAIAYVLNAVAGSGALAA